MVTSILTWQNGFVLGILGNLAASTICVLLAALHIERLMRSHHHEHMKVVREVKNLMPYEIRKVDGNGYEVINKDTGDVKAKHATKEDAERQVRLLHAIENDPGWEPTQNA